VRPGRPGRDPAPRCVGPARSGPPATPVRPPEPAPRPPGPGVVQRLGRDPLTLDVLDELLGDLGQLARGRPRPPPQLVERLVQRDPFGGRHHPFGLLDPDPAGQRLPQLGHLDLVVGQLDRGADQLEVTTANAPSAWTSAGVQARGWLAYTFRVPTGWSASRTGTLRTPRTCSCRTTTAIRSQTSSLHKSWTAPPGPRRRRPGMAPRRSRAGPPPTAASPHPWSPPTWVGRPHRSR
jgi:hypothetical protein